MKFIRNIIGATLILIILSANLFAFEIQHAGTIIDSLFAPTSLAISSDNLAVLEPYSNQLKVFTPSGTIATKVNISGEVNGLCRYNESTYLFCDQKERRIFSVDIHSSEQLDFFKNSIALSNPTDIIVADNFIFLLEAGLNEIIIFDRDKNIVNRFNLINADGNKLKHPSSFGFNSQNTSFYVLDQVTSKVWIFKIDGQYDKAFASFGGNAGQITRGGEIICNNSGLVFISDRFQNRINIYSSDGLFMEAINSSVVSDAHFNIPTGLAIDENGLLFVASTESSKIDIFYIPKTLNSETSVNYEYYFPTEFDTVYANKLSLMTIATTTSIAKEVIGFDFELYDSDNFDQPILIQKTNPIISVAKDQIVEYRSEWKISDSLEAEMAYNWRTRPAFEENLYGVWSEYKKFTTSSLPDRFSLRQNYPNPFNPETKISFTIPSKGQVSLEIINLLGQKTRTLLDEQLESGEHEVIWDSRDDDGKAVASGIYFYRLITDEHSSAKKMVLLK